MSVSMLDNISYLGKKADNVRSLFNTIDEVEELGADLAPGMKANGYIAFEIDTTWKEFEVHFDDNEKVIFKVVNEEDSNTNNGA